MNNNIVNNSCLNKIQYFHYFSIHNNNKLNQINNFNIKNQNQNINYIKIRNKKLFLRILKENKAILTINATTSSEYRILSDDNFEGYIINKIKLNGNDTNVVEKTISLKVGINIIEVIFDQLTSLYAMFSECSSLISLDLSNLNTSNIQEADFMFYNCFSLISINLSNFDTSNLDNAQSMFQGCSSLISINLSNFDTSNLRNAQSMFQGCSSLISLNLSNFYTPNLQWVASMFKDCSSLISLDLSNFDISNIDNFGYLNMFDGCGNLTFINLYNFKGNKNIFTSLNTAQLTICINNENNTAANFLSNAKKNCIMNLRLRINYCLKIKNLKYGLYINDSIIKLNKTDECTLYYDINMNEDNLIYQNILYKKNKIIRMNSEFKHLNITNII